MFKYIASIPILLMMFVSTSYAEGVGDNLKGSEYTISDCLSLSDYAIDMGQQIKDSKECIDKLSELNEIGDENLITRKAFTASLISIIYPLVAFVTKVVGAFSVLFLVWKGAQRFLKHDKDYDAGNMATNWAITFIVMSFGLNASSLDYLVDLYTKNIDNEVTNYLAINNAVNARSQSSKKEVIDSNIFEVNKASQKIGFGIIYSEFCAERYLQDAMTLHPFDSTDYHLDKEADCIDDQKTKAESLSFLGRGGRSVLNYAVKECSSLISSKNYECGFIDGVEPTSEIGKLIDQQADEFVAIAQHYDAALCDELNVDETSVSELQSYCREWDGAKFQLKTTDLKKQDIDMALVNTHNQFLDKLSVAVSKDLNRHLELDTSLFNNFAMANGLINTGIEDELMQSELVDVLNQVKYNAPYVVSTSFGTDLNAGDQSGRSVASKDGYFQNLYDSLGDAYDSEEMASKTTNEILQVFQNPKMLFGSETAEGFELHSQALRSLHNNFGTLVSIYITNEIASHSLRVMGQKTNDMIKIKTAQKLKMYNKALLWALVISFLFLPFVIGLQTVHFVVQSLIKITTFCVVAVIQAFKRDDARVVAISFIEFKLLPMIFMSLVISFMITDFFAGIWFDAFVSLGIEVNYDPNAGIKLLEPVLYLIGFTTLLMTIFITTYFTVSRVLADALKLKNITASMDLNNNAQQDAVGQVRRVVSRIF